ncbi:MAG: hypothetical protein E7K38_23075 [Bacteroides fragilis]|nr:hypothetical protein [Bacteroides fragilis]
MSMDTNKEAPGIDRERIPETITFRTADRMTYGALGYDGNELMAFISGYDLEIKFNLRHIGLRPGNQVQPAAHQLAGGRGGVCRCVGPGIL